MGRVIIAEDDPDTRALMRAALKNMDCEIVEAASGLELLELVAYGGPFDLIVTDLAMPHIDGVRVIAMVRNAGLNTPVLIVTAYPPDDVGDGSAKWLGDVKLLRKPFGLQALRHAVRDLLPHEA
jgi:two-component system, cell cycle sensor histidine kinase and response regulator CckA